MAYTTGTLSELAQVIGGRGRYWTYITADSIAAVAASGYISDAGKKRIMVGDVVFVLSGTLSTILSANPSVAAAGASPEFASGATISWQPFIVSSVSATTGSTGVPAVSATATLSPAAMPGLQVNPRNMLDCADFTVAPWQKGTSFNGSGLTGSLIADRFASMSGTSLTWTAGQTSNTTVQGFSTALCWGRSAGDTHTLGLSMGQVLETLDSIRVQGLPLSLSFWAASDANFAAGASGGFFTASIMAGTGTNQNFNLMCSGGWSGQTTVATQNITPTSTQTRYLVTGVVPTNATQLGVVWSYVATTAATSPGLTAGAHESLQFISPQLEVGPPTPFEHLEVAEVVNIATRYLQVIAEPTAGMAIGPAVFSAASIALVHVPLPSPMRAAPTVTFNTGGWAVLDQGQTTHRVSAGGLQVGNTGAITLLVTCAGTFSAGNSASPTFLQGQSTALGSIVLNSDFAA